MADFRYGIGILTVCGNAGLVLGRGPFMGSHRAILDRLVSECPNLDRVLWMGELGYRPQVVAISRANETSGHYAQVLRSQGLQIDGRNIPVENRFEHLPVIIRAQDFDAYHFGAGPEHLPPELQGSDGNVRHTINNQFSVLLSIVRLGARPSISQQRKADLIETFRTTRRSQLAIVVWYVLNLIEDGRISLDSVPNVLRLLNILNFEADPASAIGVVNLEDFETEVKLLVSFTDVNVAQGHIVIQLLDKP